MMKIYNKSIETKDHIYDKFMRQAKLITNFARKGWVTKWRSWFNFKYYFKFFYRCLCTRFRESRDPSIVGDTPFQRCLSPNIIFCQEVANKPRTYVIKGIKEILHYFVWRDIEKAVLHIKDSTGSKANRPSQGFLLNIFIILSICMYSFPINVRIA